MPLWVTWMSTSVSSHALGSNSLQTMLPLSASLSRPSHPTNLGSVELAMASYLLMKGRIWDWCG